MNRSIIAYGVISGLIVISINTLNMSSGNGQVWLGYLVMLIALSIIYVAVKQHRDQRLGGVISFKSALFMGLGISLVASVVYVLVWELYLLFTDYAFITDYVDSLLQAEQAKGTDSAELAQLKAEMAGFVEQYHNPLYRLPITLLEIFPVGLLISLISALLLRNHSHAGDAR